MIRLGKGFGKRLENVVNGDGERMSEPDSASRLEVQSTLSPNPRLNLKPETCPLPQRAEGSIIEGCQANEERLQVVPLSASVHALLEALGVKSK